MSFAADETFLSAFLFKQLFLVFHDHSPFDVKHIKYILMIYQRLSMSLTQQSLLSLYLVFPTVIICLKSPTTFEVVTFGALGNYFMICGANNRLVLSLSSGREVVTWGEVTTYASFIVQICNTNSTSIYMGLKCFGSQDGSGFIADDEIDALIHDLLKRKGEVSLWFLNLIKQNHGHKPLEERRL